MKIGFTLIVPAVLLLAACTKSINNNSVSIPTGGAGPTVTTFAGSGSAAFFDGTKEGAAFNTPTGIAIDQLGFLYVADRGNNAIRRVSPEGVVLTIAGTGQTGFSNTAGSVTFDAPTSVAIDAGADLLYVADQGNNSVRLISSGFSTIITFAGNGSGGFVNASDTSAQFSLPTGVALDSVGNVYVADNNNNVIRKITSKGAVTTFAGSGLQGSVDATGTAASFSHPQALCVDKSGNLYVADAGNNKIRKITPQGVVTTIAGNGNAGLMDGKWTASEFNGPAGVALDANGNLYIGDSGNNVIRRVNLAAGEVTTVAGSGAVGSANGLVGVATFSSPQGVAVDSYGRIFVADAGNNLIRLITL